MPLKEIDAALQHHAVLHAQALLRRASPTIIEKVGEEERFLRICMKESLAAREALTQAA
jgi:hypothetical protein